MRCKQSHVMVQQWAGSHDLPQSDRTLGPQVPVLTTVTGKVHLAHEVCLPIYIYQ